MRILGFVIVLGALPLLSPHQIDGAQADTAAFDAEYRFTVAGSPVPTGTLWLFYSGHQYFEWFKLTDVAGGRARVALSSRALKENEPVPDDPGRSLLVALEVPGVGWYGPEEIEGIADVGAAIARLGTARDEGGIRGVVLAPAVPQTLSLQNPDGTPRAGKTVTLWAYETVIGHCARPTGFGEFEATTDANGTVAFRSPLRKLFLWANYFDQTSREEHQGEWLVPGEEHLLRRQWEKPPSIERSFVFKIRGRDGSPASAEVFVEGVWDFSGCSTPVLAVGKTSAAGMLTVRMAIEDVSAIWIGKDGYDEPTYLNEDELAQLKRTGEIALQWPREQK